ncbi:MAG: tandem-95 repeat protein [Pirellulales bacterium]
MTYRNSSNTPTTSPNRTIRFQVNDGAATSTNVTNTLTVTATNDPPVINVPTQQTLNSQQTLVFNTTNGNAITVSDADAGSFDVRVTITAGTVGAPTGRLTLGTITGLSFSTGDGTNDTTMTFTGTIAEVNAALSGLRFTPNSGFNGLTNVVITVNDQGRSPNTTVEETTASAAVEVSPENDPPTISVPVSRRPPKTRRWSSPARRITIADDDAGSNNVEVTLSVTNGTLDLSGTAGLTFTAGADGTNTMRVRGTLANINTAINGLTFNPTLNYNGPAVLTVVVNDLGNTGTGGPETATSTVNITVTAVNDAPTVQTSNGATSYNEQAAAVVVDGGIVVGDVDSVITGATVTITGGFQTGQDVLILGTNNTFGSISATYVGNVLTLTGNGTPAEYQAALRAVRFSNGSDAPSATPRTIRFVVTDFEGASSSTATADKTLNVTPINDPPTIDTVVADIFVAQGGTIPDVAVTVSDVDTPPGNLTLSASSSDTNVATVQVLTGPGSSQTIRITPVANAFGDTTITLTVSDGAGGTATRTFKVSINNPPTITTPANVTVDEDAADQTVTFEVNDTETPRGALTVTVTSSNDGLVPNANLAPTNDGNGTWTITLKFAANKSGTSTITLKVVDGALRETTTTFTVTVNPVNDTPVATAQNVTIDEDNDLVGTLAGTSGDADFPGQVLTYQIAAPPQFGTIINFNPATGSFTYRPNANDNRPDFFTFTVTDDGSAGPPAGLVSAAARVEITINAVADAPAVTLAGGGTLISGNENQQFAANLIAALVDVDGSETIMQPIVLQGVPLSVRILRA